MQLTRNPKNINSNNNNLMETIQEAPMQNWGWMIGDESGIVEQIEITHFPDGREINVHSILSIITHILKDCAIDDPSPEEDSEDEAETVDEVVQQEIHKLSPKVAYLSSEVGDVHEKTVDVFNMLSNYPWEAKLTLALAAIVTNYGEYWVVAQSSSNNPHKELTKMMKFLRQMGENPAAQKSHFDVLHSLFQSMLDMIKGILKIKEFILQSSSSDYDETTISTATTITVIASYWTVRSILISAPYIHSLFANDYEPSASASKERELRIMTRKLGALLMCLQNHEEKSLEKQQCVAGEKQYRQMMCAFEEDHADNMRILKLLFKSKDNNNNDLAPIVDCSTNQRVELESLKNKNIVLMLSSGIDISKKMLHNLEQIWNDMLHNWELGHDEYKLIWFPIVKQSSVQWDNSMQHKFEELRFKMPFYSTSDPRCINPATIKFIKDKFGFKRETILVVMDGVGKILHHNAFHVLWMWTAMATSFITANPSRKLAPFPLSVEYYWKSHHWSLTDLFLGVDDKTIELISERKHAWIIGGDNMELVKSLETDINALDQLFETSSGIVYIGKSSSCREKDIRNITWQISGGNKQEYRHSWEDENKTWLFWARVESMLLSRLHFLRHSSSGHDDDDENEDKAVKTLKKLLSYNNNNNNNPQTWIIFCYVKEDDSGGSRKEYYVIEDGLIMLDAISDLEVSQHYGNWDEFLGALEKRCKQLRAHRCSRRVQFYTETLQGSMMCPECCAAMEKYTVLSCCHNF